jgi:hypothetical protein
MLWSIDRWLKKRGKNKAAPRKEDVNIRLGDMLEPVAGAGHDRLEF